MADTIRTLAALQALLADNTAGDISAQDLRDFLVSAIPTGRAATKIVKASDSISQWTAQVDHTCDGTADEVQIEDAIAALPSGGGRIILTEGTFNLSSQIDVTKSNVIISGQGDNTILAVASGMSTSHDSIQATTVSNVVFENMQVIGGGTLSTVSGNNGVKFSNCTNSLVFNVKTQNTKLHGISIADSSSFVGAAHCHADKAGGTTSSGIGVNVADGAADCFVVECYATGAVEWGFRTYDNSASKTASVHRASFINCVADGCTLTNFNMEDTTNTRLVNCSAVNGLAQGYANPSSSGVVFISCIAQDNSSNGFRLLGERVKLTNCMARGNGNSGYRLQSTNAVLVGCEAWNAGTNSGFETRGPNITLRDCIASDDQGTKTQVYGVDIQTGGATLQILGGDFQGNSNTAINGETATTVIRDVRGFQTWNSGSTSIANGATSTNFAHGLAVTPPANGITIIPSAQADNDIGYWAIDATDGTNVSISITNDPGTSTFAFGWIAQAHQHG